MAGAPSPGTTWTVWHLGSSSPTSATITVFFDNDLAPDPGCSLPTRSVARETATTVAIGLVAPIPPAPVCAEIRRSFTIHLKTPLGSRTIVRLMGPAGLAPSITVPIHQMPSGRLTARDISLIDGVSSTLTTTPGSLIEVWRGTGRQVWHAINPRARITSTSKVWLGTHELLLAICTDHPNGGGYSSPAGFRAPPIGEVEVVIDETAGWEVEVGYIPLRGKATSIAAPTSLLGLGQPTLLAPPPGAFN